MIKIDHLRSLIGQEGIAVTDLKSCGFVSINGKWYDSQSLRSGVIKKGSKVLITGIVMNRFLQVREL